MKRAVIVFGAGISGCTIARLFADQGHKVTIFEKRNHVGGNIYDEYNKDGILIQKYGPHIFHTNDKEVFEFLSRFTLWSPYIHKVMGYIDDKLTPIPFNFTAIGQHFDEETANILKTKLVHKFGENKKVPILKLREEKDPDLQMLADFIYKKVFEFYSKKQWGFSPKLLGEEVMNRVPVYVGYDDRYFTDTYQCQPLLGFSAMIQNMLMHPNISVILNSTVKVRDIMCDDVIVIYTGSIDEQLNFCCGKLKYRSLKFKFKTINSEQYQSNSVINYNTSKSFTRITEFKHLTSQKSLKTTICKEYPKRCILNREPYYPIPLKKYEKLYAKYRKVVSNWDNLFFLGRLGTYKYLNMDAAVKQAMDLFNGLQVLKLEI